MLIVRFAARLLASCLPAAIGTAIAGDRLPAITVYAPDPCLACIEWADYLRQNGFPVTLTPAADMAAIKRRLQVPKAVESTHTATVGAYFIEGHVHAEDIRELLRDRPKARGLAVPGLPRGAPGRDVMAAATNSCETGCTILEDGRREIRRELYETLLITPDGSTKVFARH